MMLQQVLKEAPAATEVAVAALVAGAHTLRTEVVIHLPTAWTPAPRVTSWNLLSEPVHGFLDELAEMGDAEKEGLFAALPGLADVAAITDEDEQAEALADWIQRRAPHGFLVKVAVPRRTNLYSCWYCWVHGETVPAAIDAARPWLRQLQAEDLA